MLAIACVLIRSLRAIPGPVVVFYHALGGLIITASYMGFKDYYYGDSSGGGFMKLAEYSCDQYNVALLGSIFYAGAFIGSNMAFQSDSSSFVALLSYMTIVYAFIFDQFYFHEELKSVEIIATCVILIVAFGIAYYKLSTQIVEDVVGKEKRESDDLEITAAGANQLEKTPETK